MSILGETLYMFPIIIMFLSISTLFMMFYVGSKKSDTKKKTIINYSIYVVVIISTIISLILFRESSGMIRKDIVFSMQNTMTYNGFIPQIPLIIIVCIGGFFGYIWYRLEKYIKEHKFK